MADFTAALRTVLAGASGLPLNRLHWGAVTQATPLDYIRMQVISDPRPQHMAGYDEARETRVQVDYYSATYKAARDGANRIIAATTEPMTVGDVVFGRIKAEGPRDLGEDVAGVGFVYRASLDLLVWHREL